MCPVVGILLDASPDIYLGVVEICLVCSRQRAQPAQILTQIVAQMGCGFIFVLSNNQTSFGLIVP